MGAPQPGSIDRSPAAAPELGRDGGVREHVLGREEQLAAGEELQDDYDPVGRPLLRHQQPPPRRRTGEQRNVSPIALHKKPASEDFILEAAQINLYTRKRNCSKCNS